MVRRNDKVAFMAGSYVFPGGRVDDGDGPPGEDATYRAAGVRELQEEANVVVPADDLVLFAHWVTPEVEIRRYDTRFFLTRMPADQVAKHDESETTALEWLSPAAAIARFERKELLLPPPTFTTIRQLAKRSSIEDALVWARSKAIVRVMPGFFKNGDDVTLTLPGDPTFPPMPGWDVPEETRFVLEDGVRWAPRKA